MVTLGRSHPVHSRPFSPSFHPPRPPHRVVRRGGTALSGTCRDRTISAVGGGRRVLPCPRRSSTCWRWRCHRQNCRNCGTLHGEGTAPGGWLRSPARVTDSDGKGLQTSCSLPVAPLEWRSPRRGVGAPVGGTWRRRGRMTFRQRESVRRKAAMYLRRASAARSFAGSTRGIGSAIRR